MYNLTQNAARSDRGGYERDRYPERDSYGGRDSYDRRGSDDRGYSDRRRDDRSSEENIYSKTPFNNFILHKNSIELVSLKQEKT